MRKNYPMASLRGGVPYVRESNLVVGRINNLTNETLIAGMVSELGSIVFPCSNVRQVMSGNESVFSPHNVIASLVPRSQRRRGNRRPVETSLHQEERSGILDKDQAVTSVCIAMSQRVKMLSQNRALLRSVLVQLLIQLGR
jgi:hypothetical protein